MKRLLPLFCSLAFAASAFGQDPFEKGKLALTARDTATALTQFKEAAKTGRRPAESNYYLGSIFLARGKVDEAIGYLRASVDRDNENVQALKVLGEALLRKNDYGNALNQYRRAVKLAPKDVSIAAGYAFTLLAADSIDAAIIQFTRAKEFTPDRADLYDGLGDAYLKQNVLVLAISNYQKALELEPGNIAIHLKLARVFFRNRQYSESVHEYDDILSIDSTHAEALLEKGRIYVLAKQYRNAIGPLQRLVRLNPNSIEGAAFYARALFGVEDFADAAKAAQAALKLDSSNVELWRVRAQALTKTRDWSSALLAFGGLKRRNQMKPEDMADYGASLVGVGREDEAITALTEAIKADSSNCDTYFPLGFIYMKRQDYAGAAAMFEKKISCDPRSLSAYVNAAACYMQIKNWGRSRELLTRSIELKPDFMQGRLWLGRYFAQVDSLDKAVEQYDEVLKLINANNGDRYKKEAGEAHLQKGQLYFVNKQYERAVDSFRRALGVGSESSGLHLMWGQALLQLLDPKGDDAENKRKKEDAVQHFRKAVQLDAGSAPAHLWLGQGLLLMRQEGDNEGNRRLQEEACAEFAKVLRLDPRNEDAKRSRERIGCK
ncbi:MAG: tetratricopeptide repeat protein [Bacteroidota bacterium]